MGINFEEDVDLLRQQEQLIQLRLWEQQEAQRLAQEQRQREEQQRQQDQ